ncbi:MAG TPA: PAS domain S-box protein [Terrimicrobiaceae bacterium]|nr:PAS domain S-box protein [Terrimicrobiaceae bacterium]
MSRPLKLLLVEDSADDAELVLAVLRSGGYEPRHRRVQTGEALSEALAAEDWDIVLSDYSMPGFDAPAALALLRKDGRGIPVIVISGTVGEDVAVETLQLGAVDYLLKANLTRLLPAIERAIRTAEESRLRRIAEGTLRRNAQIFAQLGESVLCTDLQGMITYWNPGASALHGWTAGEMLGRSINRLFPEADAIGSPSRIAGALAGGKFAGELPVCRKDGSMVWVELHVSPLLDAENRPAGCIAVARDITERRQRIEALLLRDRALAEVSQGVLICDEDRLITYANSGFCRITGYDAADILGKKCSVLQGPDSDPQTIRRIRDALSRRVVFEGEILNYRKDGTPFWNEISIAPIPGENGGPVRFIGVQRDVTERKNAQETLRQSEERLRRERALLRALVDSIPDLIFFKDLASVFLGCNKAFEDRMGVPQDAIAGKTDFELVPRDLAEFYRQKDLELLESGTPQRTEEWIPFKDGTGGYFETLKTPYYGPDGESLGLIGVSRDITERRRSEEQLRAALDRMELAAKAAGAGIWELDLVANQAIWDEQMYALFGLGRDKAPPGIERWFRTSTPSRR